MLTVRSRLLLGVGAWVIGATMATAGSLYAVGALGNSLFTPAASQLTVKMVNADLAKENAQKAKRLRTDEPSQQASRPHNKAHKVGPAHSSPSPSQTASSPTPSPTASQPSGILLTSPDGTAEAACESGGAYLLYWTPAPGYEIDDFNRGPAAVASVVFRNDRGGYLMNVSCQGGVPVKKLVKLGPEFGH